MKNSRKSLPLFLALCLLLLCTPALAFTDELVLHVDLGDVISKALIAQGMHISKNVTDENLFVGMEKPDQNG